MRYCHICGSAVSDTARFCPECGEKLSESAKKAPVSDYEPDEDLDRTDETAYEPVSYDEDDYEPDDYEPDSYRRGRREAEDDERYYREDKKTLTVGIILAVLICVVGVGLYVVVSNMLKQQPEVEVGSGLGDKPVQVDTTHTQTEKKEEEQQPEHQTEQEQQEEETPVIEETPAPVEIQASVIPTVQVSVDGYQQCHFYKSEASTVLEENGSYHLSELMIDGRPETSWQEGSDGDGIGDWVHFYMDREYSVRYLTFKMGHWRSEELYYSNNRPAQILLKLNDKEFYLTFPDGMQEYTVELSEECKASEIFLQILSVYSGSQWDDCCIAEMTVYGN